MSGSSKATPTRRIGSQEPRIRIVPEYESTYGADAAALAEAYASPLFEWQVDVLDAWLARDGDGRPVAITCGLSVPRQNGKNYCIEIFELFCASVLGWHILHTAHEVKCLDIDTPILTADGWKTMGDLTDDDLVYGADGKLASVTAHPIQYGNDCYEISFDDGQTIIADDGHRWGVWYKPMWGDPEYRVVTTEDMYRAGIAHERMMGNRVRRDYKWRVQLPEPFDCGDASLLVEPWLLGAWLGDGTSSNGSITVGAEDLEWTVSQIESLGYETIARADKRNPNVYTVNVYGLMPKLREIGVLGNKHIPVDYLMASAEQRRALLAGLMDTDGTTTNGQCHLGMKDERLIDQALMLARSLGYKATKRKVRATFKGRDMGDVHRVQFRAHIGESPFFMPRKSARLPERTRRVTRASYNAIVGIKPVETRPVRCITVHNDSELYQVGNGFIVTHNTSMKAFRRVCSYFEGATSKPELRALVKSIRRTNGQEAIELNNGGIIEFSARSRQAARGFDDIQVLVLDEGQEVVPEHMDALNAVLSASSTGTRQVIWTGTPTPPNSPGTVMQRTREQAIGGDLSCVWHEWSVEKPFEVTAKFDDIVDMVYDTNPTMGMLLDEDFTRQEFATLTPDGFARERLGWWLTLEQSNLISKADWMACRLTDAEDVPGEKVAYGVKFAVDGSIASLSVASSDGDGTPHIEFIEAREGRDGTDWLAEWLGERRDKGSCVVIDGLYGRDVLVNDLNKRHLFPKRGIVVPSSSDVATAASMLKQRVDTHSLTWYGKQERLAHSALTAERRDIGNRGAWGFGGDDPTPIESCSLALFGLLTTKRKAGRKLRVG